MSVNWKPVIHRHQNVDVTTFCYDAMVCYFIPLKFNVLSQCDVFCYNSKVCSVIQYDMLSKNAMMCCVITLRCVML